MTRVKNYLITIKYTGDNWYNADVTKVVSSKNMKEAIEAALKADRETFKGKHYCVYSISELDNSVKSFDIIHGEV